MPPKKKQNVRKGKEKDMRDSVVIVTFSPSRWDVVEIYFGAAQAVR